MQVWIDEKAKIEEAIIEFGSIQKDVIDRSVGGLDGIASIYLGERGRDISMEGFLRAASGKGIDCLIDMIEAKMNGGTCKLSIDGNKEFKNIRIDKFEIGEREFSGGFVSCKCNLVCKQLSCLV